MLNPLNNLAVNMQKLFEVQDQLLKQTPMKFVRDCAKKINWGTQLLCIRGAKGVGKSTILKQYIRSHYAAGDRTVLYCSVDSSYFVDHSLFDLAKTFYMNGGKHLFLDEVHKYEHWSREIKEIYDMYADMRVVISGSSLLSIMEGEADLSRRCVSHDIQGFSFREFLQFYHGVDMPIVSLEDLLHNPHAILEALPSDLRPIGLFKEYLQTGYYPYYQKNAIDYYSTIENVVRYVIEVELPQICKVDVGNTRKIRALMNMLAASVPYEVDMNKMSVQSALPRVTLLAYLKHLSDAQLLNLLYSDLLNVKRMQKPDKIYIENTNMLYALSTHPIQIGTIRETFAVNQLTFLHSVEFGKQQGDFLIDGTYRIEIGGADKDFSQIANLPDSYVFADDTDTAVGHKFPLWLLGFLY